MTSQATVRDCLYYFNDQVGNNIMFFFVFFSFLFFLFFLIEINIPFKATVLCS